MATVRISTKSAPTTAPVEGRSGDTMVFVKVRETYDLHTLQGKISLIGIHTPSSSIIKKNYPGLLLQCKGYRPVSCDVRLACASVLPLDPLGVGTTEQDVAPEDVFNPILYKAMSNFGMSQLDQFINAGGAVSIAGATLDANNEGIDNLTDDFDIYYGLLAQTHEWKHANPQSGLVMSNLTPLVYETYQSIGDNGVSGADNPHLAIAPNDTTGVGALGNISVQTFRGRAHALPMLNTTVPLSYNGTATTRPTGFFNSEYLNAMVDVPAPKIYCGCIVVPPSRLHQLFFRMVVEWTIEFSMIRALGDITSWAGLKQLGSTTHFMSYDYSSESKESVLKESTDLVDTSEESGIHKVM